MSTLPATDLSPLVACEVCLREVPRSQAVVPESADYVAYFCGLECFEKWRQLGATDAAPERPEG
jgi:hypothetical protein